MLAGLAWHVMCSEKCAGSCKYLVASTAVQHMLHNQCLLDISANFLLKWRAPQLFSQ
jgi:hypothetical protein